MVSKYSNFLNIIIYQDIQIRLFKKLISNTLILYILSINSMQGSTLVHQLRKIISLVDLLRDIGLDKQLSLPKIVVLGNQSSGKSSLLEQIVGLDFLPRGTGAVTRRPLELRMNNVSNLKEPYAQFDQVMENGKKKRFSNFNQVRDTINEITDKVCGSKKSILDTPIILNIFSSTCPNLTIVDLPGITLVPVEDQPQNIYEITRDMAYRYIKQPRSIILGVFPANQDLTTFIALQLMREVDPAGERSIGCLTKIDIMDQGVDATKMLRNLEVPLKYGYVGVKNRCQEDVMNNLPVTESLKAEIQFFTKSPIYSTLPRDLFSTESLVKKLTTILYQQIKFSLPQIFEEIKHKRQLTEQQLKKLGPGMVDTEAELINYAWKSISNFMKTFKNSMDGIKNTDYAADPVSSQIYEEFYSLYKEQYDFPDTEYLSERDIYNAINNYYGGSTLHGFPGIDVFLVLIIPLLRKLQTPAFTLNNRIHQIIQNESTKIINEIFMKKYPQFNSKFNDLVRKILQKHRKQLQNYLAMLFQAQQSYLYTNDMSYLTANFSTLTEKQKKKCQKGQVKDIIVFEIRKRIDAYYKIVIRNLRDLIPRQIYNFLIIKCMKQLEFEAFQFINDVKKLKQWLNQPQEIRKKRQECIKAIRILDESQKKIKMDSDISKLITNKRRDMKYCAKFGMKTHEEQEKDSEDIKKQQKQAIKKQSISKQKQKKERTQNTNAPPQIQTLQNPKISPQQSSNKVQDKRVIFQQLFGFHHNPPKN